MIILLFLMMKGFIAIPWSASPSDGAVELAYNTISLPWIPMISFVFSTLSILKSSMEMNVLNMFRGKSSLSLIGGHFPFFISAIGFRVLSSEHV